MDRFEAMLHPITKASFLADHWDRHFLHIRSDDGAKFREYPGLAELPAMIAGKISPNRWGVPPQTIHASYIDRDGKPRSVNGMSGSALHQLYNAGFSLCFPPMERAHPVLNELVKSVENHTKLPADNAATCYLTPPGSGGAMHFDCQHVFFCQVSGEKHWKISTQTAMYSPPVNLGAEHLRQPEVMGGLQMLGINLKPPEQCELTEIVLKPGDVLYLPPGTWHEPRTRDSHSLHFTLTLVPLGFWHVLFASLRLVMMRRPDWMRDLRFLGDPNAGGDQQQFLTERLAELAQEVGNLSPESLLQVWKLSSSFDGMTRGFFRTT